MQVEVMRAAAVAQRQLEDDVATIEAYNASIKELNTKVARVLNDATEQSLSEDRAAWQAWWIDQLGYQVPAAGSGSHPVIEEQVPLAYQPQVPIGAFLGVPVGYKRISCFGAGTLVHTLTGLRPIEQILPGDRVLTQDTTTGTLSYQPVLVAHHNPPSKTLRVQLGDEAILSSTFHRFWLAGQGWKMARDLKPGDAIRTLKGLVRVVAIEEDKVQPVYNLDVATNADFFVGVAGALVHDNTVPTLRPTPFDATPELAAAESGQAKP
ncbi:MAG: Hint domain-containing protein [Isosphaeraceae bacterium]|nr:Hint domain-containing protein [Isosphaeraceae bacterium]